MAYSDRVALISYVEEEDSLGSPIKTRVKTIVPCYKGRLTHNQQVGIFGTYRLSAFKLHLQGHFEDIEEVEYPVGDDIVRKVESVIHHRNSTVVIV